MVEPSTRQCFRQSVALDSSAKKFTKLLWLSPDRKYLNQIGRIMIDGRHVSSVLDQHTFRKPNIHSNYNLVAAKVPVRLCVSKNVRQQTHIEELWDGIKISLRAAENEAIGFQKDSKTTVTMTTAVS